MGDAGPGVPKADGPTWSSLTPGTAPRPAPDALCRYGAEWTATKLRWGLAVDEAERGRLLDIAAGRGGSDVEFTPAL
ncbi:hypothetical protein [Streptomyces sp. NRRL F-2580]|uniref:hypothetical protein n=1 Tax=Streptomyces sp. NRRL F-2580 TaxID=1463841 RepID=UPI0004C69637|nr:hypothetical protein [Streptomyces sp. NRRL F-2580]